MECNGTCLKCMLIHSQVKIISNCFFQDHSNFLFDIEENICTLMHDGCAFLLNSA